MTSEELKEIREQAMRQTSRFPIIKLLDHIEALEGKLKGAEDALIISSKRSSYVWSERGQYTFGDWRNEGAIALALDMLKTIRGAP